MSSCGNYCLHEVCLVIIVFTQHLWTTDASYDENLSNRGCSGRMNRNCESVNRTITISIIVYSKYCHIVSDLGTNLSSRATWLTVFWYFEAKSVNIHYYPLSENSKLACGSFSSRISRLINIFQWDRLHCNRIEEARSTDPVRSKNIV